MNELGEDIDQIVPTLLIYRPVSQVAQRCTQGDWGKLQDCLKQVSAVFVDSN